MIEIRPRQPAPELQASTLDDGGWRLSEQHPERLTMVVFYRGLHCPICRGYLKELDGKLDEFTSRGVDVIALSGDSQERAARAREDWGLGRLALGYDLPTEAMRRWGLFVSKGIKDDEPAEFGEPGLFLIRPDATVFYAAVNSMPFGRPGIAEIRDAIDFVTDNEYPARGEA